MRRPQQVLQQLRALFRRQTRDHDFLVEVGKLPRRQGFEESAAAEEDLFPQPFRIEIVEPVRIPLAGFQDQQLSEVGNDVRRAGRVGIRLLLRERRPDRGFQIGPRLARIFLFLDSHIAAKNLLKRQEARGFSQGQGVARQPQQTLRQDRIFDLPEQAGFADSRFTGDADDRPDAVVKPAQPAFQCTDLLRSAHQRGGKVEDSPVRLRDTPLTGQAIRPHQSCFTLARIAHGGVFVHGVAAHLSHDHRSGVDVHAEGEVDPVVAKGLRSELPRGPQHIRGGPYSPLGIVLSSYGGADERSGEEQKHEAGEQRRGFALTGANSKKTGESVHLSGEEKFYH